MSTTFRPAPQTMDRHADYNKPRLFFASTLALTMAGINASMRANTAADLQRIFLDPIDRVRSAEMIGALLGLPFLGYAVTIAISSPLLDAIGMGRLLPLSGVLFSIGMLIMIFAGDLASGAGIYNVLWIGALVTGIGWGLVETVVNPLVATLYPDDKTNRLNIVHAWWPGGLVIGGLLGVGMSQLGIGWQVKLGVVLIPAAILIATCVGLKFPPTERVAAGIPASEMFRMPRSSASATQTSVSPAKQPTPSRSVSTGKSPSSRISARSLNEKTLTSVKTRRIGSEWRATHPRIVCLAGHRKLQSRTGRRSSRRGDSFLRDLSAEPDRSVFWIRVCTFLRYSRIFGYRGYQLLTGVFAVLYGTSRRLGKVLQQ